MKEKPSIEITENDIKTFLQDNYPDFRGIVTTGVYCSHCKLDHLNAGIKEYIITLNDLNDVHLKGKCNICGREVGRYIAYGETPAVFQRAEEFRNAYKSRVNLKIVKKDE
jgi:hypothetical protein